jgi:hypothetical protein
VFVDNPRNIEKRYQFAVRWASARISLEECLDGGCLGMTRGRPSPWVMSCAAARGDIVAGMTHFPQPNSAKRATRVKFGGSVLVTIRSEASGTVRAKLQVLSTTGGLFVLAKPLQPGDFVAVTFRTSQGAVRGMAEILQPTRKSTSGCLQPFRFVALDDEDHAKLRRAMELQLDKTVIDVRSKAASL